MEKKTPKLLVENLTFSYGDEPAIKDISIKVMPGEFVGIIGPNGSGKSTLLKNIYRALEPDSGKIFLGGEDLFAMSYKMSAQQMAVVGQENEVPFDFNVHDIVAMGRTPHKRMFDIDSEHDRYMITHALEHVGMADMEYRSYMHLSGGEKQRVIIARAVAQESEFFVLDEPTNHLDISHQMQIFDFVHRLDVTVLSAVHDLNMAAMYCDRLYVLKEGRVVIEGTPEKVLTCKNIKDVYGVDCLVDTNPVSGKVNIRFLPEFARRQDIGKA